jgi:hypothetical protein
LSGRCGQRRSQEAAGGSNDRHTEIGAHEHPIAIPRLDHAVGCLPWLNPQRSKVNAFSKQCVADQASGIIVANCAGISGLGPRATGKDGMIHAVAAWIHKVLAAVAIDHIVTEG